MSYATNTQVSSDRSRSEIERTLRRYGASRFSYGWEDNGETHLAAVGFVADNRTVRFVVPMPSREDFRFTETGRSRSPGVVDKEWEQGCRRVWRVLALVIKAKLEAVESGVVTFDEEFFAHFVLPDGVTIADRLLPDIEKILSGATPRLLPESTVIDAEVVP